MPLQLRPLTSLESPTTLASAPPLDLPTVTSPSKLGPRRPTSRRRPAFVLLASCLFLAPVFLRKSRLPPPPSSFHPYYTNHSLPSFDKQPHRPNTVLIVPAYGGIGNQLYFLLESLILARQARLDLVIPTLPPRDFGPHLTLSTDEEAGHAFWDTASLARAVEPHGRVVRSLPPSCNGHFDAVYIAKRSYPRVPPPPPTISSRVKEVACFLVSDYNWGEQGAPRTQRECTERIFKHTAVARRYLPLSRPPDEHFVDELRNLRERPVLPSGSMDPERPACVIVDGHSFNYAGKEGHEYLYSFMHYIEPAPKIVGMVSNWSVDELTVLHLRYDEKECAPRQGTEGKVCIRVLLAVGQPHTVYWASLAELVGAVVKAMVVHESRAIYIAASPYVPKETVVALRDEFKKRVHVAPLVPSSMSHNEQNFVERELAVRSKCFIGDFASTWSGTVYYKRRTLGAKTLWSSMLLGKSSGLGYYEDENPIPLPQAFESIFASSAV